ncbi:MAG: tetratricopeptide repeat protein [Terriglobales bacterium]|jgi:tetratricopeptide (TPR) repeat protein
MMSRFASLAWLLLAGACCLAQQPASGSGSPDQSSSSQSSASQSHSGQSASSQPSSGQSGSGQNPPAQGSEGRPNPASSGQGSSGQDSPSQGSSTHDSSTKGSSIPRSDPDRNAEESSSEDTRTDITPPADDAKSHPDSKSAVGDLLPSANTSSDTSDIQEFHPWNPMKAQKDVEIGDYYFRRKNYRAAMDRYKEALYYKENDAVATYRLAVCLEKLGDKDEARKDFEQYLKILPEGPLSKDARASLEKLGGKANQ